MGGVSGVLSGIGQGISGLGSALTPSAGQGGSTVNPISDTSQPSAAQQNVLTNPITAAPAAMGQQDQPVGQGQVQPHFDLQDIARAVSPPQQPQQSQQPIAGPTWFEQTRGVNPASPTGLPQQPPQTPQTPQQAPVATAPVTPRQEQTAARTPSAAPPAPPAPPPTPPAAAGGGYPDVAGSAREAGMGPVATAATQPTAPTTAGGQQPINPLQALLRLLTGNMPPQELRRMVEAVGPAYSGIPQRTYQPPQRPQTAQTPQTAAEATAPAAAARPADEGGGAREDQMPPGSAAAAVRAGFDRAQREEGQVPPGTEPRQAPSGVGGLPPDYFQRHGGRVGANLSRVDTPYGPVTANRQVANDFKNLTADMQKAGVPGISKFGSYNPRPKRYGQGYSSHAYGAAFDINDAAGPMNPQTQNWINQHPQEWRDMLQRNHFAQYMPTKDPNHLEWTGPGSAAGQQAQAGAATMGIIPGSQSPVGTRPADVNYEPRNYANALFQIESSGRPGARTGSNRGLGQFGPAEERHFGITAANRRDPAAQSRAVQLEANENTQHLQQVGLDASPANLYFLHQQGRSGGTALLQADENTPAYQAIRKFYGSDSIAQRAIHGNIPRDNPLRNVPSDQITAGQFREMWQERFNREMQRNQPTSQRQMPIQLAGDINPDVARMVEQRNEELERDRRRNAILAGRPTLEESRPKGTPRPNRPFHPSDIDEFIQRNIGSALGAVPLGGWLGSTIRRTIQPTEIGKD